MKTMKFGNPSVPKQRAPAFTLDPGAAAVVAATQFPAAFHQALGAQQALQSIQQQALLQSMLQQSQQRQIAAEFAAQQQFAANALTNSGSDLEAQIRNRIIQDSLLGTLPPLGRNEAGVLLGQQAASSVDSSVTRNSGDTDLLKRIIAGGAGSSSAHAQLMALQQQENPAVAAAASAPGTSGTPNPATSIMTTTTATADLRARLLLGAGFPGSLTQPLSQGTLTNPSLQRVTDQTSQQQNSGDGSASIELLMFLEQQRLRAEQEKDG